MNLPQKLDNCFRNSDATRAQCLTNATNEFIPNWSNDSVLVREHLIFIRCSNWNQSSKKYKFVVKYSSRWKEKGFLIFEAPIIGI